jgi:WS/DGAT/MGAT family acyltransferase
MPGDDWSDGPEMTALEAMMWRAETDPLLRSHGVVFELLDTAPDWDRLVAAHEWAIRKVPRLRHRVIDDPSLLGPPAWAESEVDIDHHLRRTTLPDGATFVDALAVAADMHMAGLPRDRPQWQAMLVEGLPDGQAAYLLKLHHSLADGTAVVQLLDLLHSTTRAPTAGRVTPPPPPEPSAIGEPDLAARHAREAALGSAAIALRFARRATGAGIAAARDPGATVRFVRSLARVVGSAPAKASPLLADRGLGRRLSGLDYSVEELRAAGKAAGGTLNDAFLAGLLGGLRVYHDVHGETVGDLPIALPVSLRTADDEAGGNRFAGARIAGPAWQRDPTSRIRLVHARVLAARDEPALDFMGMTSSVVSRVPPPLLARLTASFTRSLDLQASNFRGLDREAYIAGARILRTFAFGPAPGCGLMATLVSHEGRCCIALTIDTAAFTDPDALIAAMDASFAEVLALADELATT